MRPFLLTVFPMLILAMIIIIIGGRLGCKKVEKREYVERDLLLDTAALLQAELARLDTLYLSHLEWVAAQYAANNNDGAKEFAEQLVGVKRVTSFSKSSKLNDLKPGELGSNKSLPEVWVEGQSPPLNQEQSVMIPEHTLKSFIQDSSGWVLSASGDYTVYWKIVRKNKMIAILINREELLESTTNYIKKWLEPQLSPLAAAKTYYAITPPEGDAVFTHFHKPDEMAALMIPIRTFAGEWNIQAWDQVVMRTVYDPWIFLLTGVLALFLIICGLFLYRQQVNSIKLAQQRVSFVNQVSHELGSPLTNITLNLDLVTDSLPEDDREAWHRMGIIKEEAARLNRMVSNVLAFSRLEKGNVKVHNTQCNPDELLTSLIETFRPALERRGIEIETNFSVNTQAVTATDVIIQVVGNLISNVEKYAYAGKWLRVTSDLKESEIIISVEDRGEGIPKEARSRVFRAFERLNDSTSEGSSGAGLGLSIAKNLSERAGGSLQLLSSSQGCRFQLTLPCEKRDQTEI